MGGDQPPEVIFEAVLHVAETTEHRLSVLATHAFYSVLIEKSHPRIQFITTEESIEMDETPLLAVRRKKNSSMAAGMRLLKEGEIDALVSAGNTGALVATAMHHLATLPGIERPALLVTMPTAKGEVVILDVGANVMPKPHQLVAYAHFGSLYRKCRHNLENPTIGLLNIGAEEQKGTKEVKETYQLLQEAFQDRFLGNTEGREVFQGKVDVLVTDGFTGNVFLKTTEGVSSFLADYLQKQFDIPEIIAHLNHKFNYSEHPGAVLCGVDALVVKCHGYSDRQALVNGILGAADLVKRNILQQIKAALK
jgi:phosphate acyltransferase